jgi:hypothetical protein
MIKSIEEGNYKIVTKRSETYRTAPNGEWFDKTVYEVESLERWEDRLDFFEIEILEGNPKSPDYKGQIFLGRNMDS